MIAKNVTDSRPMPEGFNVYEKWVNVAGAFYQKENATRFIKGHDQAVDLELDPANKHSRTAIKVIGVWEQMFGTKHAQIGYLPDDCSKALVKCGVADRVQARVFRVYMSDHDDFEIRLQIIGPADHRERYREAYGS